MRTGPNDPEPVSHFALVVLALGVVIILLGTAWLYIVPASPEVLACDADNLAWTVPQRLLRGGYPTFLGLRCLAASGVDALLDQRTPEEAGWYYGPQARLFGLEYVNLGIPDDTAPSPIVLRAWLDASAKWLEEDQIGLVHDAAGRGRMGFWDAVYRMTAGGLSPQEAIEGYYVGTALPFEGARIGCENGGNGQVQALAEIAEILSGQPYYPSVDEYGTVWANCPRPAYMDGWDYAAVFE